MSDTPNTQTCDMDVGCRDHGKCFAAQNGSPDRCGAVAFGPINGNQKDTSLENWFPYSAEELGRLKRENADLRAAISKSQDDIEQTLGRALGYPWFKDDQKNFPGATDADGVCVGDHVAESLAMEAASKISDLRARLEAAERKLIATGIWREAPCCICGYNGPGYFQPSKHKCAAIDAAIAQGKGEK